jgi:hypothetical protein
MECGLVALAAFGVFAKTLSYELVWDDNRLTPLVESIVEEGGVSALLSAEFLLKKDEPLGYYRPVVFLSLWADSLLVPAIPFMHHLTNVLLHAAISVLTLLLLRGFVGSSPFAVSGALLFAVHPVHTEAVAFVSGRTDLWATLFALVSTLMWLRARADDRPSSRFFYVASLVALFAGILSKESSLMLPVVLLAIDVIQADRRSGWWVRNRIWLGGWLVIFVLAGCVRWGFAGVPLGHEAGPVSDARLPLASPLSLLPDILVTYFRLLLVPWPLNAYYTPETVEFGWLSMTAASVLIAICAVFSSIRHRRHGFLALIWIFLFLVPALGVVVPIVSAPVAERYLYLPSFGIGLLTALVLKWGAGRAPVARVSCWVAFAVIMIVFCHATLTRSTVWRNNRTLFGNLERTSPAFVAKGQNDLAVSLRAIGRHDEAITLFRQALDLDPRSPEILNNLGRSLMALRRPVEASEYFQKALELNPGSSEILSNLGTALFALGRTSEAVAYLQKALEIRSDFPDARFMLCIALVREDRVSEARAEYELLERSSPELAASLRQQIPLISQ